MKDPQTLLVGEWTPDQPELNNPGISVISNLYPRTQTSYGPVGSPMPYSNALTARCQGATAFMDKLGNINLFSGDISKLYQLKSGAAAWVDVSRVGGYNTPGDGQWNFEIFNNIVMATNGQDAIQKFDLGADVTFSNLAAAAPFARYCAVIKGFLAVADTFDGTFGTQHQRVWWSSFLDPTTWPTPGSVTAAQLQSSYNDLFGALGRVQGIVANLGNADGAVFMEHGVFRMQYAGPPEIFDFPPAEGVRGTPAPNSIVPYGNRVFYLGEDGFYNFDGLTSTPIGDERVDKTFFGDLDQGYFDRIVGAADPINKAILWAYPGQDNVGGLCNRIIVYNWAINRWSLLNVNSERLCRLLSIGYTLDELYTVLGYSLDTLPAPLDSRIWQGGGLLLGLFDGTHKLNYLTGNTLAAQVDTTEYEPKPGRVATVTNTRPIIDGSPVSVQIGRRNRLIDDPIFTAASPLNSLGTCPLRGTGRYLRGRILTPAGSNFTHIQGLQIEQTIGGDR